MDNQHRQIKGYRELTQFDIDMMNKIKQTGNEILTKLIDEVMEHIDKQYQKLEEIATAEGDAYENEAERLDATDPYLWLHDGKKDLQSGLMKLTRAVAQPTFF
jgi:hypothetical protein